MRIIPISTLALVASGIVGCTHTPPGTSVEIALARKAEMVRMPAPPVTAVAKTQPAQGNTQALQPEKTELVADAFSRGEFCMGAGKDPEAIGAFEEAVKIDPSFADGWQKLAALYEKTGQDKKAMEAFRKAKMVADARTVH